MNLATVASQLRASQGSGVAAAQASVAVSSVGGALQAGTQRARGALQNLVGEAQARTGLLGGRGAREVASVIQPDGKHCESCGLEFGVLRRRNTCGSCDRFLCASCLGATIGISCFCGSLCPRCREQTAQGDRFEVCRADMERGVSVTLALSSKRSGLFGTGSELKKLAAWLALDSSTGELRWSSLEQRNGRPAEEGCIAVHEVLGVRNTGLTVELSVKGQTQPTVLEFSVPAERDTWAGYIQIATEVLTPETERAALDAARSDHRRREVEERRALNEDRKKKLQDLRELNVENLGMRFTAEAMVSRGQTSGHT